MRFASTETKSIAFPVDETYLAIFGVEEEECLRCMDCNFVFGSKWWTQHLSWVKKRPKKQDGSGSNNVKFYRDLIGLVHFLTSVKRRGTHRSQNFVMPNLLYRIFSTLKRVMLIWFIQSPVLLVTVAGRPDHRSFSRFSLLS